MTTWQICHVVSHADSVTWLWQVVGVVVRVCREDCGQLVAVVAVGESGEAVLARAARRRDRLASMMVVVGIEGVLVVC